MNKIKERIKDRKIKYISFFWLLISVQFVIGENLQTKGYSVNNLTDFLISMLKIILITVIFIALHYCIIELYNRHIKNNILEKQKNKTIFKENKSNIKKHKWLIYFLIIIICWIPTLLAFSPIISNYDGRYQISECINSVMSTRHPILHTLLLTIFYLFGYKYLNSCSYGMFLYSIFQMAIMALIFSYSVKYLEEKTNKKWLRNISLIFYAIFPFNQLFPLMTTKDVLFAGFTLLFIIGLYKALEKKCNNLEYIYIIIITILMLLFRNNAVYAIMISLPFIILMLYKNKEKLAKIILSFIIVILVYQVTNNILIYLVKAQKDTNQEKMSVFSQATAKICNENENKLTQEEKEKISFYFRDYKRLGRVYKSNISDRTKELTNCENVDNNKIDFIKFMIKLGIKYPREFVDSFLNTTRGYWYICDNSFNQILHEEYPNTMGCLELTFNEVSGAMEKESPLQEFNLLPGLKQFYRNMFCRNNYTKIPILYVIFQPAIYFYIVLAYLLYSIYKREKNNIIIGIFLLAYFTTCFLGPVAIIRYIYAIIVCVPVLLGITIKTQKEIL